VSSATFDTFHQILIIVEALRSQPVLLACKHVVVARSESRAVRRVVGLLPVEMLQQCSSSSSCMRTRIFMDERYTVCQHSTSFVLNGHTQHFQCFSIHFWSYRGPMLFEFHHQHSFPVPEYSFYKLSGRQRLVSMCAPTA
jgi:hypothetical protein